MASTELDPGIPDGPEGEVPTRGEVIGAGLGTAARWSLRLILIAAGLTLIGLLLGLLWSIVFPILLGLVIATVLEPPASWLRARGLPPALATALVLIVAFAVIAGVVVLIAPSVVGQAPLIAGGVVGGIQQIQDWLEGPPFNLGSGQIGDYVDAALSTLQDSAGQIATGVVTGLTTLASGIITAILALVLAFLFVKDGPRFLPWLRRSVGQGAGVHLEQVCRRGWMRLGGFIRSQALIGVVDATFIGIGLALFGVPLALPLAVLVFFGAFVPIVGALVSGAVAVLVALVVQGPAVALGVLILIVAVQQIEGNLLQPIVQGRGLGLNAAVVILAVAAGASLGGVAGAFLAVPAAAVVAEIVRYIGEQVDVRTGETGEPDGADGADGADDDSDDHSDDDSDDGGARDGASTVAVDGRRGPGAASTS